MKQYVKAAIVAIFLALMTCCGPYWSVPPMNGAGVEPSTWYVCVDLPTEQLPAAHKAVEVWDKAIGQWKHLKAVDGGVQPYCRMWVHTTTHDNAKTPTALAWVHGIGGSEIEMRVGRYEQDITGILLHEIGHALGAQHVGGTLMNEHWYPNTFTCPDRITVVQIAEWNHVNLELFSWCYY